MKSTILAFAAFAAQQVSSHATFQQLWVDGVDQGSKCARLPPSNSPIENVSSTNFRCNANTRPASAKCSVPAGSTVQVEMHQQTGDRSCANEAIGGKHYGPVIVYLSKVGDASTADGSSSFFKIYQNGWAKAPGSAVGDNDYWGVKDMEKCCGKVPFKIPSDIAPGDYLLRAEVIALHAASSGGGAQFYMTCYQITVTGGGSATPAGVVFPGAYKASDPGIGTSIHGSMSNYIVPGPAVVSGGTTQTPGNAVCGVSAPPSSSPPPSTQPPPPPTTQPPPPPTTQPPPPPTTQPPPPSGCASMYGQCGGSGFTGPTCCSSGTCKASNQWYSQCL